MQIIVPVGYREDFPVTRKPQTFLKVTSRELFATLLKKLEHHEVIVTTPFTKYFKDYDVQVVKDEGSGSASCLKAVEKVIDGTFVVHYSDIFTPFRVDPLIDFHRSKDATISIGLTQSSVPWRHGVVSTDPDGRVVRYLYKPRPDLIFSNKISSGIFVMEPEVFDKIPYKMRMNELISYFVHMKAPVYGQDFKPFWYHLGGVGQYVDANNDFLRRRMELTQNNVSGVNIYPPVHLNNVAGKVGFIGPSVSAEDAKLGKNVKIVNSVILPGARIKDNVNISDSIIGPKVTLEKKVVITESLIGEGSRVGAGAKVGRSIIGIKKEVMENVFEIKLI
ncbi:MAG: NDP-sugar synthase [Candidatus Altiarchaeota archaeon]|nr:NDP-sugar synthase [Candidatus Altiarchaeota archaeon]